MTERILSLVCSDLSVLPNEPRLLMVQRKGMTSHLCLQSNENYLHKNFPFELF